MLCCCADEVKLTAGSFRLSILGLRIIVHKLMVDAVSDTSGPHVSLVYEQAFEWCPEFSDSVENITPNVEEAWAPCEWLTSREQS